MWSAFCPSALESKPEKNKTTKKNKQMEVHDWLKYRVVCFVFLFFGLDFKAEKQIADSIEEIDCVQRFFQ